MAELTNLESKLGEVVGLAMAAQEAGKKVAKLAKEDGKENARSGRSSECASKLEETEERGTAVASSFEGKKTAILEEARDVKSKAQEMMKTYLDQASDALDGFEFLTMAEAGEVGHWEILDTLNKRAGNKGCLGARTLGATNPAAAPRNRAHHFAQSGRGGKSERSRQVAPLLGSALAGVHPGQSRKSPAPGLFRTRSAELALQVAVHHRGQAYALGKAWAEGVGRRQGRHLGAGRPNSDEPASARNPRGAGRPNPPKPFEPFARDRSPVRRSPVNQADKALFEPRTRRKQLQGSWRENGSPPGDPFSRSRPKK